MRICRVATVPFFFLHHLGGQIRFIADAGHEVDLICSRGPGFEELAKIPGIRIHAIEIPRRISPLLDAIALIRLFHLFRRRGYDIVHSTTPKAGLLSALAGRLAGVPVRMHTFTGQPWAELSGIIRWLAVTSDRVVTRLNTQCYADSGSQQKFLVNEGICTSDRVLVLGAGSLAGVDIKKTEQTKALFRSAAVRKTLAIPDEIPVIAFVGRVTRDKGIVELIQAFEHILAAGVDCFLIIVGPFETGGDAALEKELTQVRHHPKIRLIGYDATPGKYLAIADLLCLPSYREGFGNVVIESAVMGIPTVGTSIIGLADSVVDGVTGLLVQPKDSRALADALVLLLRDKGRRTRMGLAARERAIQLFDAARVNESVLHEYERHFEFSGARNRHGS